MKSRPPVFNIAMLSIHSSPIGDLGSRDTGGMSVYIRELARGFGRHGHSIDIFTRRTDNGQASVIALYDNVRIIHLSGGTGQKATKSSLVAFLPQFFHDLEAFRIKENIEYDVIHSHYWLSGILGVQAALSWNVCHMFTYHTIAAVKKLVCPRENESDLRLSNEKELAKLCDQIVVPTRKEKNYLIQSYEAPQNKIQIVPCGVNFDRFKPINKKIARRQLSIPMEDLIVLYVGRYDPIKGLDRLFTAFGHLKHLPRIRLFMVGGDGEQSPMVQHLRSKATALNIEKDVTFAGRVDQKKLPAYYSAADVFVVPSYYESFGLAALEALACGTPVVTTPVGAMEMIVQNGVTGYVATDSDPRHFAQRLEAILLKQQADGLSPEQIRASVREFSWERSVSKMLEVYRTAVRR